MSAVTHIEVRPEEAGWRFDRWAKARFPGLSFGQLQKLCRTGQFRLDGKRVEASDRPRKSASASAGERCRPALASVSRRSRSAIGSLSTSTPSQSKTTSPVLGRSRRFSMRKPPVPRRCVGAPLSA